tara:strand:- start:13077 stop:13265 length:189 start_codon:yes stop_codon:yes gene_type:complete
MTKYKCEKCGIVKELRKATLIFINDLWKVKESYCLKCDMYMTSKTKEGFPNLIRTESSLRKK